MGALCAGPPLSEAEKEEFEYQKKSSKNIDQSLQREMKEDHDTLKLLLLGAGESGKSTLFKQLIQLYGKGFSEESRMPYASIVYTNCILGMKSLIRYSDVLDPSLKTRVSDSLIGSKNFIVELGPDSEVDEEVAKHIRMLWADPGIANTFANRSSFQLSDSCRYFFDEIEEIGKPGYIPTYTDILQCRARTTGIVETSFAIDGNHFLLLDVGGQRNERKKWIHCFEKVTAVIFVAAINEYDQALYEDGVTNRVEEALSLFGEMCNSRWFRETSMILFLNKSDLFREKISHVDMSKYFHDYVGGMDFDAGVDYLTNAFLARNEYPTKHIYPHVTCATNTDNIFYTFTAVKDIIIKKRLAECGLLVQ